MRIVRVKTIVTISIFSFLMLFNSGIITGQQENLNVFDRWIEWTDGKNMLAHHFNDQAFAYLDRRDEMIAGLKTREDWIRRQQDVRDIFQKIVGPFPERTPLNAKITGIIKKEGFRAEKIIYESMPGFYVTGCLFIPSGIKGKCPAILFVSGHTPDAFRYPDYQVMILNLVKKGFIVFAIDPVSQGERTQHYDATKNASMIGPTTREHTYLGNQCFVSGVSLGRYFIWDGIRGIDYLLTRKEVDPSRLGVTGQSGGGTQSSYIFAFDERIKAGAPVNYITGFRRLLESIGPQDSEQNFYHGILNGITHADLLEVRAPNPALIVAGTRDFFSIQGARETYEEVRSAYRAFGKEENIGLTEDDWGHGYTPKLREGIYAFFQKHLECPGNPKDETVVPLSPEELKVTTTGQVASTFQNAETVFSLNSKETQKLEDRLEASRLQAGSHLKVVSDKARELSGYIVPQNVNRSVFRGRYKRDGYSVEMYALQGEGDYVVPLLLFVPESVGKHYSVVYIHPKGKIADAQAGGAIERLVKNGWIVAAPDLIGTGETEGRGSVALLIGRSMPGIQAGDVMRVVNFLRQRNDVNTDKIAAAAFDEICPTLLHAAAFDKSIGSVVLSGAMISYRSFVMNKFYDQSNVNYTVPGALTAYDLPDLMAAISPRRIALIESKDQLNQPAPRELMDRELAFPLSVYSSVNAGGDLNTRFKAGEIIDALKWCFEK